jgi:hypothetical protein
MNYFKELLIDSYNSLKNQRDLSPHNDVVNEKLSLLVNTANEIYNQNSIFNFSRQEIKFVEDLRIICSLAECEMEKYWADHFNRMDPLDIMDLKQFWYYHNYEAIAEKEYLLLKQSVRDLKQRRLLFAGAGAMPLTAILMNIKYGLNVTLLDLDGHAVEKAGRLIEKIGLKMPIVQENFFNYDLSRYDVVFVAGLIHNKYKVFEKMETERIDFYLLRGADGIYQAFYEDIPANLKMGKHYDYLPSDNLTINSSYLFSNGRLNNLTSAIS